MIVLSTLAGLAAGVAIAYLWPVKFTAQAKIMPPQPGPSSTSMLLNQPALGNSSSLSALAGGPLSLRNPNSIYVGMLNSRPVADAIIQRFHLKQVYRAADLTATRRKLGFNTEISSEKEGFILISVTDSDRTRAAQMANAYIDALRALTLSLSSSEAADRKGFYDRQLREAKEALLTSEFAFQRVQQTRGLVQIDAQTKSTIEALAAIRAQVTAKKVALQSLRSYSTDRNPQVEIAERELASLQAEESRLKHGEQGNSHNDLALYDLTGAGLDYVRAEHEVKYRQMLLDLLIKQYDAARLDEAKGTLTIQVLEPAIEPEHRSSPHRRQVIMTSTFLGFAAACAWVLLLWAREYLAGRADVRLRLQELRSSFSR
jgi:tyrosine-protein kinase Etk/Wzc